MATTPNVVLRTHYYDLMSEGREFYSSNTNIGNAFVDAYNRVVGSDSTFLEEFIEKSEDYLRRSNLKTLAGQNERKLKDCQTRMDQIAGLLVDGQLSQEAYDRKFKEISIEKGRLQKEKEELDYKGDSEANAIKNLETFRKAAVEHNGKKMDVFMPEIFDACVEKIIVGGKDDAGNPDPYMMTFIFKKGFGPTLQANKGDLHGKLFTPILGNSTISGGMSRSSRWGRPSARRSRRISSRWWWLWISVKRGKALLIF
jgi:hypothetical protein